MVCIACLLPLFLVPIVNLLPVLFDFIMARVYRLFGWEYRKPERAPPACPYRPLADKAGSTVVKAEMEPLAPDSSSRPLGVAESKQD